MSTEVSTLAVTLCVLGLGTGPILVGPLAEVLGQQTIYLLSFFLMWCFTWPVAFSHSIGWSTFFYSSELSAQILAGSRSPYLPLLNGLLWVRLPEYRRSNYNGSFHERDRWSVSRFTLGHSIPWLIVTSKDRWLRTRSQHLWAR